MTHIEFTLNGPDVLDFQHPVSDTDLAEVRVAVGPGMDCSALLNREERIELIKWLVDTIPDWDDRWLHQ